MEQPRVLAKAPGDAVAQMRVEIDIGDTAAFGQSRVTLQSTDHDSDVVVDRESFARVGLGVMKAATQIERQAVFESSAAGGNRTGGGPAHRLQDETIEQPPGC